MRTTAAIALLLTLVLGATGCSRPASVKRPSSTATLAIVSPAPGDIVPSGMLRVRLKLEGGRIIPETRYQLTPDEGHIHLSLNGQIISMAYGVDQEVAVPLGSHLLEAEFVAADHLPFDPRVISTVTFKVK